MMSMQMQTHTHTHTHTHMHACTHTHTHTHTLTHTHTHACTHAHAHTHTPIIRDMGYYLQHSQAVQQDTCNTYCLIVYYTSKIMPFINSCNSTAWYMSCRGVAIQAIEASASYKKQQTICEHVAMFSQ